MLDKHSSRMGKHDGTKSKVSMNKSNEINFQTYVQSAKQRKTPWIIFESFMKELTYSNIVKLKHFNAILLIELTMDYSDLDRLKYLNSILLTEFKELIEKEDDDSQNTTANEHLEESENFTVISNDPTDEIIKEENEPAKDEVEDEVKNEVKNAVEDEVKYEVEDEVEDVVEDEVEDDVEDDVEDEVEDEIEDEVEAVVHVQVENEDEDQAEDKIEIENKVEDELKDEDQAEDKIEIEDKVEDELEEKENLGPISTDNVMKSKPLKLNENIFSCSFCNKKYGINFHLKQHIKNVHEEINMVVEKENLISQQDLNDETIKEIKRDSEIQIPILIENERQENFDSPVYEDLECDTGGKLFSKAGVLKKYSKVELKDYRCDSCSKSFTTLHSLEVHLHTVHDGYKDYKCEFCGKSFSQAVNLKKHIKGVHEDKKRHKCESCRASFIQVEI